MTSRMLIFWIVGLIGAGSIRADDLVYRRHIKPLLKERCSACHGALQQKANLRIDTVASLLQGGESGPAIVPGKPEASLLLQALRGEADISPMPPEGQAVALTQDQIQTISDWILSGAEGPKSEQPEADPRDHWAFRRPTRPAPPITEFAANNPLDQFLAAEWTKRGLKPMDPAPPEVQLRRVSLDLIGLPPSPEELAEFLADPSEEAWMRAVNRLLDSPQYGERWARHWMDIWRYADWYGRRSVPDWWNSACQVWRWRDWIVSSLNADRGYDEMICEMLAGDEVAADQDDRAIATGYLARNWYALNYNSWMRDNVEHTAKAFLGLTFQCAHCHDHKYDPISNTDYFRMRAFFEPLEMRQDRWPGEPDPGPFEKYDYAKLRKVVPYGAIRVFDERPEAPTYVYSGGDERNKLPDRPPVTPGIPSFLANDDFHIEPIELPPTAWYPGLKAFIRESEIQACETAIQTAESAVAAQRPITEAELSRIEAELQSIATREPELVRCLETDQPIPDREVASADEAVMIAKIKQVLQQRRQARLPMDAVEKQLSAAQSKLISLHARIAADDVKFLGGAGNGDELSHAAAQAERESHRATAEADQLQAEVQLVEAQKTGANDGIKKAEQKLTEAKQAFEKAVEAMSKSDAEYSPLSPIYPANSTGRRTGLARWISGRQNPLTARVAVNHIWYRHFGQAIVESVQDFGRNGKPPTHPELLDWLAMEFMDSGWSQKHIHRLIVTSRMYRQSSATSSEVAQANLKIDPDNRWYWRYPSRRLEAEIIRDSLLSVAGVLDLTLGGKELEVDQDGKTTRRSLYYTSQPDDYGRLLLLENFDLPDTCDGYRRSANILPQQALALTNSPTARSMSQTLATHLRSEIAKDLLESEDRNVVIQRAFVRVLSRPASPQEITAVEHFWDEMKSALLAAGSDSNAADQAALESLVHALLNHHEFVTLR